MGVGGARQQQGVGATNGGQAALPVSFGAQQCSRQRAQRCAACVPACSLGAQHEAQLVDLFQCLHH